MTNSEHNFHKFKHELHKEAEMSAIDFLAVEAKLFARIQSCERLGVLGSLKADVIPPSSFFESIEQNLTARISNYLEYDEPIDECIKRSEDMTKAQWDRLELKLDEKIRDVQKLPLWEISIKTPIDNTTPIRWEVIESQLFSRINSIECQDDWELYAKKDEIITPGEAERAEQLFEKRMDATPLTSWEKVLKSEEVLPYKSWEEHEEKLFSKIDQHLEHLEPYRQPFWFIIENYTTILKSAGVLAVLIMAVVGGFWGKSLIDRGMFSKGIPSIVYQIQGASALYPELANIHDRSFRSVDGGSVTFVNDHGSVSLQNESSVEIQNVSLKEANYRVNFSKKHNLGKKSAANVAFYVKKNQTRNSFKVKTADYEIVVKGTYFKIEPDITGRVSTRVLEGVVEIHSQEFGDTLLHAGQSMVYDLLKNRYTIHGNGPIIARDEIGDTPETEELLNFRVIAIKTDKSDAAVIIDGKEYGMAPLTIRQPIGTHRILVEKDGFSVVDTIVNIIPENELVVVDLKLEKIKSWVKSIANVEKRFNYESVMHPEKPLDKVIAQEFVAEKLLDSGSVAHNDSIIDNNITQIYISAQKAELSGDWRAALKLYKEVFSSYSSSKLRKEDALFSIGKLYAEHESDITDAKQVFLKYLALYPNGSFSGECWLRLAELEFKTTPMNSIQYYNRFIEMFPRHPRVSELQNRIGVIYLQSNRYKEAVEALRFALSKSSSSNIEERKQIYANLYKALEKSGDTKGANLIKKEQLAEIQ